MDSVRFGRVLGIGARLAAKTLAEAVDAATSSDPSGSTPQKTSSLAKGGVVLRGRAVEARVVRQVRATSNEVQRDGKRFGEAMWGPVARASGVLWLEVTGVFFGLVAMLGLDGMWANRAALHWSVSGPEAHSHFVIGVAMATIFGYFGISSFLRASRRGRPSR